MATLIDFILYIDVHLIQIVDQFGDVTYLILSAIIFIETGVITMPFLPGDSLLSAASVLAADPRYHLNTRIFIFISLCACLGGDPLNSLIGHKTDKGPSNYPLFGKLISEDSLEHTKPSLKSMVRRLLFSPVLSRSLEHLPHLQQQVLVSPTSNSSITVQLAMLSG